MRTSLIEIKEIETFLSGDLSPEEKLLFEAKLIVDPLLSEKKADQLKAYEVISLYGRKKLKQELELIHQKLFSAPANNSFKEKILRIFSK